MTGSRITQSPLQGPTVPAPSSISRTPTLRTFGNMGGPSMLAQNESPSLVAPLRPRMLGGIPPAAPDNSSLPSVRPLATFGQDTISAPTEVQAPAMTQGTPAHGTARTVLGKVGSALGTAFLPNLMPEIPGTRQFNEREEAREAGLGHTRAETGLEGAQAGEATARTAAIPIQAQAEQEQAQTAAYKALHPEITEAQLQQHEMDDWISKQKAAGKTDAGPADFLAYKTGLTKTVPEGQQPVRNIPALNKANADAYQALYPGQVPPPELTIPDNATTDDYNRVTKALDRLESVASTQAQRQAVDEARKQNQQMAQESMELRKDTLADTQGQRSMTNKEKVLTYYDPVFSADDRLKLMEGSLPAALKGDQQAMLNIVANHVNMVMGVPRGKVGRVPQTLFQEAEKSAPYLQRIGAKFDKDGLLSGVTLTPQQMKSMVELGKQTLAQEKASADSKLDYLGIPPEDRPQIQSKAAAAAPPAGATHDVLVDGKVVGHVVNGKYVAEK